MAGKRESLSESVQNQLRQMLMNGTFKVGEYMPSEQALCERFDVSRTTIRDAISGLVEMGFVERHHGKGIYVIDKTETVAAHSLRTLMLRGHYTVAEFLETRYFMEPTIAYYAAKRVTEDQFILMQDYTLKMVTETEDPKVYAGYDVAFHMELAKASQNSLLLSFVWAIRPMLENMVRQVVEAGGLVEKDSHYHKNILDALYAHDADLAKKRMEEHLQASERMFRDSTNKDICELWVS